MTPAQIAERGQEYREQARSIVARLERYEDEHPHVDDGAPCLGRALEAATAAVARHAVTS